MSDLWLVYQSTGKKAQLVCQLEDGREGPRHDSLSPFRCLSARIKCEHVVTAGVEELNPTTTELKKEIEFIGEGENMPKALVGLDKNFTWYQRRLLCGLTSCQT